MSDWIEQDGKKYFEQGYLKLANRNSERRGEEIKRLKEANGELLKIIKQNKTQWEGMKLALQTHGTNINVPFFIDHFEVQIANCQKAGEE